MKEVLQHTLPLSEYKKLYALRMEELAETKKFGSYEIPDVNRIVMRLAVDNYKLKAECQRIQRILRRIKASCNTALGIKLLKVTNE